ncbi:zinc finger MYM-type protein 1-like [Metopolophium dirhodum]|uniref:zinc finger MYM-type protein 1-like n=2 Tax=Metopolophium dirhodum TaxID=44670 RepID=UPI002990085A|nr:zinc finger MYM-type protein 1-like [Metopolophium dirhodum]
MFSIFKKRKRKPKDNNEENEIEADIDDPGMVDISTNSTTHTSDTTLDLGNKDSGPCRPILTEYKKIKFGTQQRSFRSQWYNECDWLEYSVQRNAAFCFVCRTFGSENSGENIWIKSGFNNWQKFLVKSKKHSSTSTHLTNLSKMCAYKSSLKTGSVVTQLSSAHKKQVEINRKYMSSLIDVVLYLAKQGIAFRGHNENLDSLNQGNYKEMCHMVFSKFMPDLKNVYENKINHTSWKVQDEIIKISADLIKEIIVEEIVVSGNFALMVDEARSHKEEQLSVCVRYAVGLEARERFLQFIDVSNGQTANHIISAVFNCFQNLSININTLNIVAQSYDGASVMAGHLGGVQAKIKQQFPCAIYTHCMAHRLNLIVVDMCKGIKVLISLR